MLKPTQSNPPEPEPANAQGPHSARLAEVATARVEAEPGARPDSGFARDWLAWQSQMVAGMSASVLYLASAGDDAGLREWINWPPSQPVPAGLRKPAARAILKRMPVVESTPGPGAGPGVSNQDVIALALEPGGEMRAALVVSMSPRSEAQQQAVLRLLQWGAVWLERRLAPAEHSGDQAALDLARRMLRDLAEPSTAGLSRLLADRLAEHLGCHRVAVGLGPAGQVKIWALSQQQEFDPRSRLVQDIAELLDETVDVGREILVPRLDPKAPAPSRFHRAFAERYHSPALGSWPLCDGQGCHGAVLLEWRRMEDLDRAKALLAGRLVELAAPALRHVCERERRWYQKPLAALGARLRDWLGPKHWRRNLFLASAAAALAAAHLVHAEYRIGAEAVIEGARQQAVIAPRAGFISDALVRAGDAVEHGQELARLDTRDIDLELTRWDSTLAKHRQEYHEALADHERTAAGIAAARMDEAAAQLNLLRERQRGSILVAPFAGVVVSGDLSQAIGGPVELGEVLFEVAAVGDYRIALEVDERDVAGIEVGQSGVLRLAADPGRDLALRVERLVPMARAGSGRNRFRVEAALTRSYPDLRPGMAGVAKLDAGQRSLWWILTHELFERLGLWAWSVGLG